MSRRDQYGTHDDLGERRKRPSEARRQDERAAEDLDRGHRSVGAGALAPHEPDYGGPSERRARTERGVEAAFEGRDYERDGYGGGYGTLRERRDVPAAGRKGEWMHAQPERPWRGQVGGDGLDGLASERAFGTERDRQQSAMEPGRPGSGRRTSRPPRR